MNKKALLLPAVLVLLVLLGAGSVLAFRYLVSPVSSDQSPVAFTIEKGEPVSQIASRLEKEGLIRSSLVYRVFVRISGFETRLQAGKFILSKNLAMKDLTYRLARGTNDQSITTLEGWRVEEIASYLDEKKVLSKEEFLEAASTGEFNYEFLPRYEVLDKPYRRLEGYLFPDTYLISAQSSAEKIISVMLDNFSSRVTTEMRADAGKVNLTLEEAVNLASIVEREVRTAADRPVVAGILLKRIRTPGRRLEADATVQFAKGTEAKWWPVLSESAKNISPESPYNSYTHDGLPPTPVSNPGLASIRAVIYSEDSDYWFYISDSGGKIHYAKTIEEHNANIDTYLR